MKIVIDISENVIEETKSSPNYYPTYHFEKIWRAIANGTPVSTEGDLISRSALKEEFKKIYHCAETMEELSNTMEDAIDNAPTVTDVIPNKEGYEMYNKGYMQGVERSKKDQNRTTGEWIDEGEQCGEHWFKCSVCDTSTIVQTTWDSTRWNIPLYNYCPYCGARMVKDDEKG